MRTPTKAGRRAGKERLSRVYLDDYPITLMGDEAQPPLSRIVRAGGKDPDRVDVVYLTSPSDRKGRVVDPSEIVDRTAEPARPIYLRSVPKPEGRPITTALPEGALGRAGISGRSGGPPAPDADPVISQLGRDPRRHRPGVFRSPSQLDSDDRKRGDGQGAQDGSPGAGGREGKGKEGQEGKGKEGQE